MHNFDKDKNLKEYRVLHDKARAILTRAEVELDRNLLAAAGTHLRMSQRVIDQLNEHAAQHRLKVPQPKELIRRRVAASNQLESLISLGKLDAKDSPH
jgi:hypothetical protein